MAKRIKKVKTDLTTQELLKLELHHREKKIRHMEISALKKDALIIKVKKESAEVEYRLKMLELNNKIRELSQMDKVINSSHTEFINTIKIEAKIEGESFGYCPDTGSIYNNKGE